MSLWGLRDSLPCHRNSVQFEIALGTARGIRNVRMIHASVMNNARRKSVRTKQDYVHAYPSCSRTYATLCIYHDRLKPEQITAIIRLKPDRVVRKGEPALKGTTPANGWFLTTQSRANSKDLRFHIALLIRKLIPRKRNLTALTKKGCELRIMCFWESASGNGGPYFDHAFLQRLSALPLDLDLDIWFVGDKQKPE